MNAKGRSDIPMEQQWETALHEAASAGDLDLARLLLRLGADPDVKDTRFDATPLGWARHFGQQAMIALLEPVDRLSASRPTQGSAGWLRQRAAYNRLVAATIPRRRLPRG